jgi:dynein heavy chain
MYPALINNTTINWFMGWPEDALTEVAMKFVGEVEVPPNLKVGLAKLCCYAH